MSRDLIGLKHVPSNKVNSQFGDGWCWKILPLEGGTKMRSKTYHLV